MTRKEWKHSRKHPDRDFEKTDDIDGATIFWSVILFLMYAIICYQLFGY